MTTKETIMKRIALILVCSSVSFLGLVGCGSGGGSTSRPQKTAIITFSTVSSAHTAPLEGIQLKITLPAGAGVSNISTALVGRNDTGQLVLPNYNPPVVSFGVFPTGTAPIKFGTFAELKCDVAAGFTLDQSSFSIVNADIQMTGKDSSGSTVDLVSQIPAKLSISFGY
jgi:hypothetical protein